MKLVSKLKGKRKLQLVAVAYLYVPGLVLGAKDS